ncbi:hypothetical protein ACFSKL_06330 [Belliella marina]|uniref:Lipoprotein n=1 Tax=Belliella marina TaxID=1644146 RepID=A0ABW4VIA5_9BACT
MHSYIKNTLTFTFLALSFISCQQEISQEIIVYENDFSEGNTTGIENANLENFVNIPVLGFYNNEELILNLSELPSHKALRITVDILLHDSWDGNVPSPGGPDIWYMKLDNQEIMNTTFSNSPCTSTYCLMQSFPGEFPNQANPKTGAFNGNLPGRCQHNGVLGYTSRYIISKAIPHNASTATITLGDILVQENAANPICDESWSLNRIVVSTLEL